MKKLLTREEIQEASKYAGMIYSDKYGQDSKQTLRSLANRVKESKSDNVTLTKQEVLDLVWIVIEAFDHTHFGRRMED